MVWVKTFLRRKNNASWNSENKSKLNGFPMTHPWDDCAFTYTFTIKTKPFIEVNIPVPCGGMGFLRSHDICTSFSGHDPLDW